MKACMTPEEWTGWTAANNVLSSPAASPCSDCPMAFANAMRAVGCCDGTPGIQIGRPRLATSPVAYVGRRSKYATDAERTAARRLQWREYNARKMAAA